VSNSRKHRGRADADKLPVLWHQSLLSFCQRYVQLSIPVPVWAATENERYCNRYASNLTPDQKDALIDVVRANPHHQIGPEVRRELAGSSMRGSTDITMLWYNTLLPPSSSSPHGHVNHCLALVWIHAGFDISLLAFWLSPSSTQELGVCNALHSSPPCAHVPWIQGTVFYNGHPRSKPLPLAPIYVIFVNCFSLWGSLLVLELSFTLVPCMTTYSRRSSWHTFDNDATPQYHVFLYLSRLHGYALCSAPQGDTILLCQWMKTLNWSFLHPRLV